MNESSKDRLARFQHALQLFLDRLGEDPNILAAVLVGSLCEETMWRRERIYLWLIEVDGVTKKLRADGDGVDIYRTLCEEGINIPVQLIPRSRFRKMVEGTSRTAFSCNFFAKRELVYCSDPSIEKWFDDANTAATKDREKELLATTTWAIYAAKHARKLLDVKKDVELARQTLLWGAHSLASMEVVRRGEIVEDDVMYLAMEWEPELYQVVYVDVLAKKSRKTMVDALSVLESKLEEQWPDNLKPLIHFLKKHGGVVPLTELGEHFAFSQLYPWHLESCCEWLEERGVLEKLSSPFKLTKKSRVDVEEPAYLLMN